MLLYFNDARFVEHGEFNGNLYGTTFDQVTSIVNAGLVCVLCLNPKVSTGCELAFCPVVLIMTYRWTLQFQNYTVPFCCILVLTSAVNAIRFKIWKIIIWISVKPGLSSSEWYNHSLSDVVTEGYFRCAMWTTEAIHYTRKTGDVSAASCVITLRSLASLHGQQSSLSLCSQSLASHLTLRNCCVSFVLKQFASGRHQYGILHV